MTAYLCPNIVDLACETTGPTDCRTWTEQSRCLLPAGHDDDCTPDALDALISLHQAYDNGGCTDEAWQRLLKHKEWLTENGHESAVDRYDERCSEAAQARGYW